MTLCVIGAVMKIAVMTGLLMMTSVNTWAKDPEQFWGGARGFPAIPIPGFAGCTQAKKEAKQEAKMKCHQAGYKTCKKISVRVVQRNPNFIAFFGEWVGGDCLARATYEGIESDSQ